MVKKKRDGTFSDIKNEKTNGFNRVSAFIKALKIIAAKHNDWNNSATVIPWLEHNLINIEIEQNEVKIALGADTFEKELKDSQGSKIIAQAVVKTFNTNNVDRIQININKDYGLRDKLRNNELIKEIQKKFSAQIISIKEKKLWQSETSEADSEE